MAKIEIPKIGYTKDLSVFVMASVNRATKSNKALKESIARHGLLPYYPIVVTPNMEVIDGQHRIAIAREIMEERAAKGDTTPIIAFYVIDDRADEDLINQILTPNIARRDWTAADYLHAYVEQNKDVYKQFDEATKHLPFSGLGNNMVVFSRGKTSAAAFKKGNLVGDVDFYNKVVSWLLATQCKLNGKTPFVSAITTLFDKYADKLTEEQLDALAARLSTEEVEQRTKAAYIKRFLTLCGMNAKQRDKFLAQFEE